MLSAKYYPHGTFLKPRRGFDPSFVPRSIWGAKPLLSEGLKWRVGNGEQVRVWDDAWLPGDTSIVVPTLNLESPADLKVSELINEEGDWDVEALNMHFTAADATLIRELPLNARHMCDVMFWWPAPNDIYTTKSWFWLGRIGHIQGWMQRSKQTCR